MGQADIEVTQKYAMLNLTDIVKKHQKFSPLQAAYAAETDKIRAVELGADDYIVKPFSPGEFLARLRALLRRSQMPKTSAEVDDKLSTPSIKGKLRIDFTTKR